MGLCPAAATDIGRPRCWSPSGLALLPTLDLFRLGLGDLRVWARSRGSMPQARGAHCLAAGVRLRFCPEAGLVPGSAFDKSAAGDPGAAGRSEGTRPGAVARHGSGVENLAQPRARGSVPLLDVVSPGRRRLASGPVVGRGASAALMRYQGSAWDRAGRPTLVRGARRAAGEVDCACAVPVQVHCLPAVTKDS